MLDASQLSHTGSGAILPSNQIVGPNGCITRQVVIPLQPGQTILSAPVVVGIEGLTGIVAGATGTGLEQAAHPAGMKSFTIYNEGTETLETISQT